MKKYAKNRLTKFFIYKFTTAFTIFTIK